MRSAGWPRCCPAYRRRQAIPAMRPASGVRKTPCLSWPSVSSGDSPISAATALAAASGSSWISRQRAGFLLAPDVDDLRMCGRELVGHRAQIQRRLAVLGELAAGDQILAALAQVVQRRQPGVGGVDVAAVPCGQDGLRLQVDQLNIAGGQPILRQRGEQAVVRRRGERGGDPLAPQLRDGVDAGAVAGHQRLVVAGHVEHERDLVRDVQRRRQSAGHRAGSQRAEVEFLGDERGVDVGAGVELRPLDVVVGQRLFQPAVVLDDEIPAGEGLVADPDGRLVGLLTRLVDRATGQRRRGDHQRCEYGFESHNFSSPGDSAPFDGAKQTVDDQAGDADGEDADEHDRGVVVVACVLDQAADSGDAVEQFGGDHRRVRHADRQPDAGERLGQCGRDDDVADDLTAGGAQRAGGLLQSDGCGDDGSGGGDGGGRQRREGQQRDLGRLVDAEPDHQQEEVGQRRQRAQERQPRLEHAAHPADRTHDQAEQHTQRHADDDAGEHAAQRHVEVLRQQVARVPADAVVGGGDVEERAPHRARIRHERLVPDSAGGDQLPHDEEDDHRQQRQCGTGEPAAPFPRGRDDGRRADLRLVGSDIYEHRHCERPSVAETKRKWFSDSRSRQTARRSFRYWYRLARRLVEI